MILRHTCQRLYTLTLDDDENIVSVRRSYTGEPPVDRCPCGDPINSLDWFENPFLVEPIERQEAIRTYQKMACSNCWGQTFRADSVYDDETGELVGDLVICTICLENTRGYVSRRYVTKMKQRDMNNYMIAKKGLRQSLDIQQEKIENPLRELGF